MRETYKTTASLQTGKISHPAQDFPTELKPAALGLHRKNVLRQLAVNCGRPPVSGVNDTEPPPLGQAEALSGCAAGLLMTLAVAAIAWGYVAVALCKWFR